MRQFEQRLCEKLKSDRLEKVADDCMQNIIQFNQADAIEVEKTLSFLIQYGFYHESQQIILWLLEKNQTEFIWKYLGLILAQNQLPQKLIEKIENWASQQPQGFNINYFVDLPNFKKNDQWQQSWKKIITDTQLEQRKQLFEKVQTARNQSLSDQEEIALHQLSLMYPQDRQIKKEFREFRERKAFALLDKYKNQKKVTINKSPQTTESNHLLVQHLSPELNLDMITDDLVVAALMIEDYSTAVDLIQYLEENEKNDWLKMEVLSLAERGAELIELSFMIESKYTLNTENYYSCLYYRALAYELLDEKQKAIGIMKEILAHDPHYRKCAQLLREWSE